MVNLTTLKETAEEGLRFLRRQKDVHEAELFVADNAVLTARLNYVSHIPCNGVEEPKSFESYGLSVRGIFKYPKINRVVMANEPGNLSIDAVQAEVEEERW